MRGEQRRGSDLDVLVEFDRVPTLLEFVDLQYYLSDLLGVKVDLVMKKSAQAGDWPPDPARGHSGMRSRRTYVDYLRDILDHAQKAERFTAGIDAEAFRADDEKAMAVVRALEIIGEAARHLPASMRQRHPAVIRRAS